MSFWNRVGRAILFLPAAATSAAADVASAAVKYLGPKPPSYGDAGSAAVGNDSPNNRLTAQSNQARAYQAIPDVYGLRRVWPDMIQPSIVEYIGQVKYITEWLCVSRGKGTLSSIQFADTPLDDVEGASYEIFEPVTPLGGLPEDGTTTLLDVYETFYTPDVNGQELTPPGAYASVTRAGTVTQPAMTGDFTFTLADGTDLDDLRSITPGGFARISADLGSGVVPIEGQVTSVTTVGPNAVIRMRSYTGFSGFSSLAATLTVLPIGPVVGPFTLPIDADRIWWNTALLRGLSGTVNYTMMHWRVDAAGVEIDGTRNQTTVSLGGATLDQRFYTDKTTFDSSGRWRVLFVRTNADLGNGTGVIKLESVSAVRYYPTKELPGVTVLRVTTSATDDATGFRERKFNARWLRHVVGLNASNAVSPSRNFARAMAHIWRLVGRPIAGLDLDKLAAINAAMGEDSALLRFDGSLDDAEMSLGERMQFVADTARCTVWRDGSRWTVTRDEARGEPVMQFDYRNLARSGDSVLSFAAHIPDSNDGVELEYIDEATQASKAYARLNISSWSVVAGASANPKKFTMLGCATQAQAENRAHLEARRLLYQRTFVADTALCDALSAGLGDLVRWVDPDDFGGDGLQGGEVLAVSGDVLTLSEPVSFGAEASGRMHLTGEDGGPLGPPVVCTPVVGNPRAVRLAAVPVGLFVAGPGRQCGSRYAFAAGLTEDEMAAAGLFVLVDASPAGGDTVSVSLASYSARLYEMDP